MKGYFGIGAEGTTKGMNLGSLFRSAHAFGASFVFTIDSQVARDEIRLSDTADTPASLPYYSFADAGSLALPKGCTLVGIEITDDAVELPRFRHPRCAAYVVGGERASLSPALTALCDHVVRIPTRFSLNLALAGAIVMYDRLISLGLFPARPVMPGGATEALPTHVYGAPVRKRARAKAGGET